MAVKLVGDVEDAAEVIGQVALEVEQRTHRELNIAVNAQILIQHTLTGVEVVTEVGRENATEHGHVEDAHLLPEAFHVRVVVHAAEFSHVLVELHEEAVGIIERGGHARHAGEHLVALLHLIGILLLFHVVGDVMHGIEHIGGTSVLVELHNAMTLQELPLGRLHGTHVPAHVHLKLTVTAVEQV